MLDEDKKVNRLVRFSAFTRPSSLMSPTGRLHWPLERGLLKPLACTRQYHSLLKQDGHSQVYPQSRRKGTDFCTHLLLPKRARTRCKMYVAPPPTHPALTLSQTFATSSAHTMFGYFRLFSLHVLMASSRNGCLPSNEHFSVTKRQPLYVLRRHRIAVLTPLFQDTKATQAVLEGVREGILRGHLEKLRVI